MTIEKAFAIEAEAAAVWEALWADLSTGEGFEVEHSSWPSLLSLRLHLAGVPCLLTYRITPREGFSEVSATLEPEGLRYRLTQVLSFGHQRRNFEIMLTVGLSNLKAAVEGPGPESGDDQSGAVDGTDAPP